MAGSNFTKIVLAYSGGLDTSAIYLYNPDFATFEADQVYQQADATGFIRPSALRIRIGVLCQQRQG